MNVMRVRVGLAIVVGAAAVTAGMAVTGVAADRPALQIFAALVAVAGGVGGIGLARLARFWQLRLEQLRGWVNLVSGTPDLVRRDASPGVDAIDRVQLAIIDMVGMRMDQQASAYRKFEEVLNALPDGVAVITPEGLVSLVNAAGRGLFAAEGSVVGKSVFETLSRDALADAIERSRAEGRSVSANLVTVWDDVLPATVAIIDRDGSTLLRFPAAAAVAMALEHDLSLHDRAPGAEPATAETPLIDLPVLVVDTETTGLEEGRDRVISIGGVRMLGTRLFRNGMLNLLVNPGRTIPARVIAIHGISNAMVADAPPFSLVARDICDASAGAVLVGHGLAFDVNMLLHEMRLAGVEWQPTAMIDVMALYAGLFPDLAGTSLDEIAGALGVAVIGRHSALGDALTTGEIFARLIPLLAERGIRDLGSARAFQAEAAAKLRARGMKSRAEAGS